MRKQSPTLELETEPEHRLTTLQGFTRTWQHHGTEETCAPNRAESGRIGGKHRRDDVDQRTVLHDLGLDDANLLLPHAPQNWPRVRAPGRGSR